MGKKTDTKKVDFDFYKCGTYGPENFSVGERVIIYLNNVESAVVFGVEGLVSRLDPIGRSSREMIHLKVLKRGRLDERGCVILEPIKIYGGRVPYVSIGHVEKLEPQA